MLREIVSREGGGTLSLLNYGLLTLVQVVPGFLSFVGVRCVLFARAAAAAAAVVAVCCCSFADCTTGRCLVCFSVRRSSGSIRSTDARK